MAARRPGNLPAQVTSFIGRRSELRQARHLLTVSRLVTLVGAGGVGKSRLALRIAEETERAFPDGTWLVELAALQQGDLVPHAIASALGVADARIEPTTGLAESVTGKQLLLVLDNCEQVIDATSVLVAKLLAAEPKLRVVTTSRQPLRVEGEHILEVPPLSVPRSTTPDESTGQFPAEAVDLFVDRARAVAPTFGLTPDNRVSVDRICQRVDGVPLAIELAAVRCRALTPDEILARLDDALELLTSGHREAPRRQRTLVAAIAWSAELCSPAERLLWARLSIFVGAFDLDAAEKVGVGPGIEQPKVFELVSALVDKSILARAQGSHGRRARFTMLQTLRQYGLSQLSAPERIRLGTAHRDFYRRIVNEGDTAFFGPGEADWLMRLRDDHANLRAALEFCIGHQGGAAIAQDIAARLESFWLACGLIREGFLWLRRSLEADVQDTPTRARALAVCGHLGLLLGERDTAASMLAKSQAIADDEATLAHIDWCMAMVALSRLDTEEASRLLAAAENRYRAADDLAGVYRSLYLSGVTSFLADEPLGLLAIERAVAMADESGAGWSRGYALWILALYRLRDGQVRDASSLLHQSLESFQAHGDRKAISQCIEAVGWCAESEGHHERAAQLFGAADSLWEHPGGGRSYALLRDLFASPYRKRTEEALGDSSFKSHLARGQRMTFSESLDLALERRPRTTPAQPEASAERTPSLTRREAEIARLVGEGLSNKEIAERLVISPRTAEAHVEHILAKLGFRSRAQIAAWITDATSLDATT